MSLSLLLEVKEKDHYKKSLFDLIARRHSSIAPSKKDHKLSVLESVIACKALLLITVTLGILTQNVLDLTETI